MVVERPWEENFCEKCTHCFAEDICNAYRLGMSHAYCPQIRDCEKFKDKYEQWRTNHVQ